VLEPLDLQEVQPDTGHRANHSAELSRATDARWRTLITDTRPAAVDSLT
jgi:hypothetical protein